MADLDRIEIPFRWTCPKCETRQTTTVNPILGPFVTTTCDTCGKAFSEDQLAPQDRIAFDDAVAQAEHAAHEEEAERDCRFCV